MEIATTTSESNQSHVYYISVLFIVGDVMILEVIILIGTEFDVLVVFTYKGNSFALRVTPCITLDKVFNSVCSKWKDHNPYMINLSYVPYGNLNDICTNSNL